MESFGSRVRSKSIGDNTYTGRRNNFLSKPTPIHGPVHKYYLNYSYLRSHFGRLTQAVAKEIISLFSHEVSYSSMKNDPVINGFSPNDVNFHLDICNHSIVTFGTKRLCLRFSNTSYVESLNMFRKSVVDQVKLDMCI